MQGFDADHPNINILRLRNYTIGKRVSDDEVTGPNGLSRIADLVGILTPFVSFSYCLSSTFPRSAVVRKA